MKRALFTAVTSFVLLFSTTMAFADEAVISPANLKYTSHQQPIAQVLKQRTLLKGNLNGVGPSTDIIVINYTPAVIHIYAPTSEDLDPELSTRIQEDTYLGQTYVDLGFWASYVPHRSRVSIVVRNGNYVVDVKNDY